MDHTSGHESPFRIYSVPRRFDVATLLVVTSAFSLLFGALRLLGAPAGAVIYVGLFVSSIGLGQAFLFRGAGPRKASILSGAIFNALVALWLSRPDVVFDIFGPMCAALSGGVLGYFAGVLIAGIFLVSDRVRCGWRDRRLLRRRDLHAPADPLAEASADHETHSRGGQ